MTVFTDLKLFIKTRFPPMSSEFSAFSSHTQVNDDFVVVLVAESNNAFLGDDARRSRDVELGMDSCYSAYNEDAHGFFSLTTC